MSLFRMLKGLTLTVAGSVLIATSAIALSELHEQSPLPHCAIEVPST
jgi:hypothetical protein